MLKPSTSASSLGLALAPRSPNAVVAHAVGSRAVGAHRSEAARRGVSSASGAGGRFMVDFFAPEVGLVIDVDGGCHAAKRSADARRDEKLRRLGCRVLRLEAEVVCRQPIVALERVLKLL